MSSSNDEVDRVDSDQDRPSDEPACLPAEAPVETPDAAAHQEVSGNQQAISQKVLVDRINRSDFWMIILTAAIAFSGLVSAVIFGKQLIAMNGQLAEMRAARES